MFEGEDSYTQGILLMVPESLKKTICNLIVEFVTNFFFFFFIIIIVTAALSFIIIIIIIIIDCTALFSAFEQTHCTSLEGGIELCGTLLI